MPFQRDEVGNQIEELKVIDSRYNGPDLYDSNRATAPLHHGVYSGYTTEQDFNNADLIQNKVR